MKIAIVGCSHGELDRIYQRTQQIEMEDNVKVDLLICCGDFQATRNEADLRCMAVPPKFYNMGSFYKYYSGERTAPILTLFIGGNHEASNYLQELPYGGWVAPNIYYLGYAGVVSFAGLRIGGLSGIFKPHDYMKGHFEKAPYNNDTKRSVYHVRNLEVFRLKQISNTLDIMLSHDWPREVYTYGDVDQLIRNKPFFEQEVNENKLGSQPCQELLSYLKPKNWFAAHLHTKFCAQIPHFTDDGSRISETNFMALDKCLPRRRWIEIIDVPTSDNSRELTYDLEWLTILYLTDHLMSSKRTNQFMPGPYSAERWKYTPTDEEKTFVKQKMNDDLRVPANFVRTAPIYDRYARNQRNSISPSCAVVNPQTVTLCERLGVRDPISDIKDDFNRRSFATPEKYRFSNDVTYLSFNSSCASDRNESFYSCRSSVGNDSSVFESSESDRSPKKVKLSLPPMVYSSTSVTESSQQSPEMSTDSMLPFTIDRNGSLPETSYINDSEFLSFTIDKKGSLPQSSDSSFSFVIDRNGSFPETSTPRVSQFKRRNANLYSNQDE